MNIFMHAGLPTHELELVSNVSIDITHRL